MSEKTNEMVAMEYKGYTAIVGWSDEDESFVGRVVGTNDRFVFFGDTIPEAREGLELVVDGYIKSCRKHGDEPNRPVPELVRRALQATDAAEAWVVGRP